MKMLHHQYYTVLVDVLQISEMGHFFLLIREIHFAFSNLPLSPSGTSASP